MLPRPGSLSTSTSPPSSRLNSRAAASPIPSPPAERVEALALSPHAHVPSRHRGLVLGFAPFSAARIRKSVEAIRQALDRRR